jgi:preprotein translocase subunit SecE
LLLIQIFGPERSLERSAAIVAKTKTGASTTATRSENAIVKYFKGTRAELRKVTWPTREETKTLTTIIVIVTVAMAIFLGLLDYLFQVVVAGVITGQLIGIGVAVVLFIGGAAAFYFNAQQE